MILSGEKGDELLDLMDQAWLKISENVISSNKKLITVGKKN